MYLFIIIIIIIVISKCDLNELGSISFWTNQLKKKQKISSNYRYVLVCSLCKYEYITGNIYQHLFLIILVFIYWYYKFSQPNLSESIRSRPLRNVDPKTLLHGDDFCRFQLYFTRIAWKLKLFDTITCFKYTLKPKITPIRVILKIKTNDVCRVAFLVLLWQLMYG